MIEVLNSWAKGIGFAIVIVAILEMLLPNNKTKKYIKVVMGIYILFNIISPFVKNKNLFKENNFDITKYANYSAEETSVNQASMDERIQELYIEELEKDITDKVEKQGYSVSKCKVNADIKKGEDESNITKIQLQVKKDESKKEEKNETTENMIVTEIQKIKEIDTKVEKNQNDEKVSKTDIQNLKKFLINEYGVDEKCLQIN